MSLAIRKEWLSPPVIFQIVITAVSVMAGVWPGSHSRCSEWYFPQQISPQTHTKKVEPKHSIIGSQENSYWGPLCWVPECPWTTMGNKVLSTEYWVLQRPAGMHPQMSGHTWERSTVRPDTWQATGCSVLGHGKSWGFSALSLPMQMRKEIKGHVWGHVTHQ